jgi:polysaccharide pyruvyl transferase WcaK-like protein
LHKASFVSLRDRESASILNGVDPTLKLRVAPDCVFLLPELFSHERMAELTSPAVRDLVRKAGDFFCFQCNSPYGDANREELKRQLLTLAGRSGMRILLVPTARIWPFEDHVFLNALADEVGDCAGVLPASATIYDVAYTLASGRLFCGTSLHGVITALAYDRPFVPLATGDPKLGNNIESWGLRDTFPLAAVSELAAQGLRALNLDRGRIGEQAEKLRSAARDNMQQLARAILAG